jgi:hypothetical protein
MSEFLQNLRRNREKMHDRSRKQYKEGRYGSQDRRHPNYRHKSDHRHSTEQGSVQNLLNETFEEIKNLLQNINQNQKDLSDIENRKANAEERKAGALEEISNVFISQNVKEMPFSTTTTQKPEPEVAFQKSEQHPAQRFENFRKEVLATILQLRKNGLSYQKIAVELDAKGIPTLSGRGKWHAPTIQKLVHQTSQ